MVLFVRRLIVSLFMLCACSALVALDLSPEEKAFIKAHPKIVVGGEIDWPPMDFVEDDVYQGVAKDYLDEIAAISGLNFDIVTGYTWGELMGLLDNRKIDMVPMMYWTDRRSTTYNMTNPYVIVRHYAFTKGKRSEIVDLDSLSGMTVAVPTGYAYIEYLADNHPAE